MGLKKILFWFLITALLGGIPGSAWAGPVINIVVQTVLASQDSEFLDPRITALTRKLQSVFRYSSYRLLTKERMRLKIKQTGTISLPGNRKLKITPMRITGNRAEFQLLIFKKGVQVIQSRIQILNRGSIVVGGPEHKGGFLLFDIFNAF